MFLKLKRCGKVKGRGCADGRPQRQWMDKSEVSSKTPATESVLLTCIWDAHEGRYVVITDIPGEFLQADQEDLVIVKIEGSMAEALLKIKPELYTKYVVLRNGNEILYVRLKKAIYGLT